MTDEDDKQLEEFYTTVEGNPAAEFKAYIQDMLDLYLQNELRDEPRDDLALRKIEVFMHNILSYIDPVAYSRYPPMFVVEASYASLEEDPEQTLVCLSIHPAPQSPEIGANSHEDFFDVVGSQHKTINLEDTLDYIPMIYHTDD